MPNACRPIPADRRAAFPRDQGSRLFRGYTALTDFLRDVRPPSEQGFEVRFETPPGEQAQVDFASFMSCSPITDDAEDRLVVFHGARYSRSSGARFVMHQNLPTVLRCHVAAFGGDWGVPREILYDRMKTQSSAKARQGYVL